MIYEEVKVREKGNFFKCTPQEHPGEETGREAHRIKRLCAEI